MRAVAIALLFALALDAEICPDSAGTYQKQGYTVESIRLRGPLRHFRLIRDEALTASLPQKARLVAPGGRVMEPGRFDANAWSLGTLALRNRLTRPGTLQRFELVLVTAGLENCRPDAKTLDVVYTVFAFGVPASVTFGRKPDTGLVIRTLLAAGFERYLANAFPQPLIGYNQARGWYGGTQMIYQAEPGGLFDVAVLRAAGSANSLETGLDLQGSHSRDRGLFRERAWGLNYRYSDQPGEKPAAAESAPGQSGDYSLREGLVSARYAASTKPFGAANAVLRFGGAVDGGASQTGASPAASLLRSNSVGSLKLYAGTILQAGPYAGRLSYGVQRTQQGGSPSNGFFKHLVDTRHEFRFLPWRHRPISVEIEMGGGLLPARTVLPAGEGFYGGNAVRQFIPGDEWDLRADPSLRSLPQLSLRPGGSAFGATRFFAWNTTVAPVLWGRPLLPKELLDDPLFPKLLEGQLNSAETLLSNDYIIQDAVFGRMRDSLRPLGSRLPDLRKRLQELRKQLPGAAQSGVDTALSFLDDVDIAVETALEDPKEQPSPTTAYRTLAKGFGADTPPTLDSLAESLRHLKDQVSSADSIWLEAEAVPLLELRTECAQRLDEVEQRAEGLARKDLVFARRLKDRLLNEVNLISVAPAFLFDAVKVGPEPVNPRGWRLGAGAGLRLSLVNVNLTLGYSFNLGKRAGEPRGAFLLQFSVTDLFR